MSNGYCTLVGTNKISEDFNKITQGFDGVESDMIAQDTRIDNHVSGSAEKHTAGSVTLNPAGKVKITASEVQEAVDQIEEEFTQIVAGDANAEVGDAHISTAKDKTFDDIRARFEEIETDFIAQQADTATQLALKADQADLDIANENISGNMVEIGANTDSIAANTIAIAANAAAITGLASGAPKAVATVAEMTDHSKNYVYTGSEGGYTAGNWYYWNGSAWTSGGVYNSTGVADNSLTKAKFNDTALDVERGSLLTGQIAINTTAYTVTIGSGTYVGWGNNYVLAANSGAVLSYAAQNTSTVKWVLFDTTTNQFEVVSSVPITKAKKLICTFFQSRVYNCEDVNRLTINGLGNRGWSIPASAITSLQNDLVTFSNLTSAARAVIRPWKGKRAFFLGDSITAFGQWTARFIALMELVSYEIIAVAGATLCDQTGTVYDGDPQAGANANNTLGNQVQKIINNAYAAPDYIIIFIGTNDSYTKYQGVDIEQQFTNYGSSYIDIATVDKKTISGAMRYAVETLQGLYPSTQIFICTTIQSAQNTKDWNIHLKNKNPKLKELAYRLALPCIDVAECGIYGAYESNGSEGKYLADGLHPNTAGGYRLGEYIARFCTNWFSF